MHALQYTLSSTSRLASVQSTLRTRMKSGGRERDEGISFRNLRGGRGYIAAAPGHFHSVRHLHRNELYPLIQTVHVMHGFVNRYDLGKLTISNSAFPPLHEPSQASWTILKKMKLLLPTADVLKLIQCSS